MSFDNRTENLDWFKTKQVKSINTKNSNMWKFTFTDDSVLELCVSLLGLPFLYTESRD